MGLLSRKSAEDDPFAPVVPLSQKQHPSEWSRRFAKWSDFDILSIFEPKRGPLVPRRVLIGVPLPPQAWLPTKRGAKALKQGKATEETVERYVDKKPTPEFSYSSNQVLTSKYNLLTFIPKNLLEQFRRVANIFFLVLVILQFFPEFLNVSPALAALPLLVVLGITAIKDGFEDYKRHQNDRGINSTPVRILQGGGFLNPNLTMSKAKPVSFRFWGLDKYQPRWLGGTGGYDKEALHASDGLAPDGVVFEKNANGADDTSITQGHKRTWWGHRKVVKRSKKVVEKPAEPPVVGPGGGNANTNPYAARNEVNNALSRMETNDPYADVEDASPPLVTPRLGFGGLHLPGGGHHASPDKAIWLKVAWEDLRVGDFVKLKGDEAVPADMAIVSTSEEENVCYVETKNLDGETNLKSRNALPEISHIRNARDCATARFVLSAEAPDNNMFRYNAAFEAHDGRVDKHGEPLKAPVTLNTVLLRGTVIRNTDWVIGCVITTGRDTKIVMNSGATPSKRSKVERQMNPQVFINLFLLALACLLCAIGDHFYEVYYYNRNAYWEVFAEWPGDNPRVNGAIAFANAMITFQNIVPISLYISIEFVRLIQALFIWADDEIYYAPLNRRTHAKTWNLSDDLGQIEYIFSDKTGTLTQNSMVFHHCTVGGQVFRGDDEVPANVITHDDKKTHDSDSSSATRVGDIKDSSLKPAGYSSEDQRSASINPREDEGLKKVVLPPEVAKPFHDAEIERILHEEPDSSQGRLLHGFFVNLALCHTVLAAENEDGSIHYKAQSPDEAALVQAAADVGFVFCGRDKNILKLQTPADIEPIEYELLEVLEFTSARKRMSVVVRKLDDAAQPLFLLSKGADNIIFERLKPGQEELMQATSVHLDEFANEGLRTLTLAYKGLDEGEYLRWAKAFHEATLALENREERIDQVAAQIEGDLMLLGATAIEDKLQDGVPEAIADLKRAGIKIWVATGDKLETAVAIGMSSNLLTRDMNLIVVRGGAYGPPNSAYEQMKKAMSDFFPRGPEIVQALYNQPPGIERVLSNVSGRSRPSFSGRQPTNAGFGDADVDDIVGAHNGERPGGYGLVIEGTALTYALSEPWSKDLLLELSTRCKAVICCRTSPLQKALIVKLVRDGLGAMTLAIGDGANDVSMIQAADVGVGVAGEEGLQAVNSSDYSIGQFRFLTRLLLVHGHWSYSRNASMIVNFFYKEMIGIAVLFFFQFYCLLSTTTVYEYTYLLFWNIFWTLLPVLAIGLFDRPVSDRIMMALPELYSPSRRGTYFTLWRFGYYMAEGIFQGAIVYFLLVYTYQTTTARENGYGLDLYVGSTTMVIAAVFAANLFNGLNTNGWNWFVVGSVALGPILVLAWTGVYSAIRPGWIWTFVFGNNEQLWPSAYFWFGIILTVILSLLPRLVIRYWKESYRPSDIDILKAYSADKPANWDYMRDPAIGGVANRAGVSKHQNGAPQDGMYPMERRGTFASMTPGLEPVHSRGFGFDADDEAQRTAVVGPLRRYTSSMAGSDRVNRARSGSIRRMAHAVNIFPALRHGGDSIRRSVLRPRSQSKAVSDDGSRPNSAPNTPGGRRSGVASPPASPEAARNQQPPPGFHYIIPDQPLPRPSRDGGDRV